VTETMWGKLWGMTQGQMNKLEQTGGLSAHARIVRFARNSLTEKGRGFGEQLFRNQQVRGSSPRAGSRILTKSLKFALCSLTRLACWQPIDDVRESQG
jgi:hypothetical protein